MHRQDTHRFLATDTLDKPPVSARLARKIVVADLIPPVTVFSWAKHARTWSRCRTRRIPLRGTAFVGPGCGVGMSTQAGGLLASQGLGDRATGAAIDLRHRNLRVRGDVERRCRSGPGLLVPRSSALGVHGESPVSSQAQPATCLAISRMRSRSSSSAIAFSARARARRE